MEPKFEKNSFGKSLKSMITVDLRRMFTQRLLYIMIGICLAVPILILIMTTMMEGSVSVDPNTGVETVAKGFDTVWQIFGALPGAGASAGMDMTSMCNINLLYFGLAVFVGLFVTDDFKSGYVKNLFTVRARKSDYVISKTIACVIGGTLMVLAFLIGTLGGGVYSGLPFTYAALTSGNIVMCILAKIFLIAVFVPIFLFVSILAKQKTWIAIVGGCGVGMLLFSIIPMMSPLDATMMNVLLCLAGGILFTIAFGSLSKLILSKKDLI